MRPPGFPQSHDCGLIEAFDRGYGAPGGTCFPQSHDCGLIEASTSSPGGMSRIPFRSLTTAA